MSDDDCQPSDDSQQMTSDEDVFVTSRPRPAKSQSHGAPSAHSGKAPAGKAPAGKRGSRSMHTAGPSKAGPSKQPAKRNRGSADGLGLSDDNDDDDDDDFEENKGGQGHKLPSSPGRRPLEDTTPSGIGDVDVVLVGDPPQSAIDLFEAASEAVTTGGAKAAATLPNLPGQYPWGPRVYSGECLDYKFAPLLTAACVAYEEHGTLSAILPWSQQPMYLGSVCYDDVTSVPIDVGEGMTELNLANKLSGGNHGGADMPARGSVAYDAIYDMGWHFDEPKGDWRKKRCKHCGELMGSAKKKCPECKTLA